MSEFKVIETQEQFDAMVSERLRRERETSAKRYEGWMSPDDVQTLKDTYDSKIKALEDAAATTQQELDAKDKKIEEGAKYRTDLEKTRIALAAGLKIEYADRLRGETEEEWKADAETLAKDFAASHYQAPLGSPEPKITKEVDTKRQFADWVTEKLNN